ncbi:MAG: hypothetical protein GY803_09225, partial [Chloroflexi bacterium]|nr:hypothetical protein [Chloroflexota bacterium]
VLTGEGDEAWLASELVDEVDVMGMTAVAVPVTPTPAPTSVAAAPPPPPAAPPTGENLLIDPGFEYEAAGWNRGCREFYSVSIFPKMVRSGQYSCRWGTYQLVTGLTEGTTYRFGIWGRVWSSNGEERGVSDTPHPVSMRVCIDTAGDTNPNLPTSVCSNWVDPGVDTWHYFTIDGVATADRIVVMMSSTYSRDNAPYHIEVAWDDAYLGLAPTAATPTPAPAAPPARPAPVPFNAVALRDNMTDVEWALNQMGGLLDRLIRGSWEPCDEYEEYYRQVMESSTYHSIPDGWHGIYNEYIFAVDNAINFNSGVYSLCESGGGGLNQQAYGDARSSIANGLERLIPAIQAANALLGE